ncbi:hypothetical protein, partial [Bacillus smithii]|uniref:hypothetical protein n=1 Tax=Bacillus smithii TaxID=1479 RepID=UPI001C3F55DA
GSSPYQGRVFTFFSTKMGNPYTEQQLDILAITNKRKCLKRRIEAAANQSIFTSSVPSTTRRKKIILSEK